LFVTATVVLGFTPMWAIFYLQFLVFYDCFSCNYDGRLLITLLCGYFLFLRWTTSWAAKKQSSNIIIVIMLLDCTRYSCVWCQNGAVRQQCV